MAIAVINPAINVVLHAPLGPVDHADALALQDALKQTFRIGRLEQRHVVQQPPARRQCPQAGATTNLLLVGWPNVAPQI